MIQASQIPRYAMKQIGSTLIDRVEKMMEQEGYQERKKERVLLAELAEELGE